MTNIKLFKKDFKIASRRYTIYFLLVLLLSIIIMLATFLNASAVFDLEMFISYLSSFEVLLFNLVPIFACMLLCFILSKRLWFAFGFTAYLFYILSLINKFKIRFRDDPFVLSDFKLINEARDMGGKYDISLSLMQILILIGILLGTLLLRKMYKNIKLSRKSQGLGSLLLLILSLIFVNGWMFNKSTYERLGDKSLINRYSNSQDYQSKGFVYPFIHSYVKMKVVPPDNYDVQSAKDTLKAYRYVNIPEEEKVNVISIMLESFNDLGKFEGVEFDVDVYSKFNQLQKESISGNLVTNVFAGGTVDTERAFLNGFQAHPDYPSNTNSFVWYFADQGYYTEAKHPFYGWFYNRRNINQYLGFQNFDYIENYYGDITYDDVLFQDIIKGYEQNLVRSQPYFNFTVTYQGHGPYSTEKWSDIDYLTWKEGYNEDDYNNINNYLSYIADTIGQIDTLISYFKEQEEPVIVVLFGDHNPLLNDDSTGFSMLGVDLDIAKQDGFLNYYETPYVIWGNQSAKDRLQKDFIGEGSTISPNLLMNELFQYIGWEGNEYMQYLSETRTSIDVFNSVYKKFDGKWTNELTPAQEEIFNSYRNVEFYYSNNYGK